MKIRIGFFLMVVISSHAYTQENISWSASYDATSRKAILTAELAKGWHIYSQTTDESVGPVATQFELDKNKLLIIESPMIEPQPTDAFDPNFEGNVKYFEKKVNFEQKISATETTEARYTVTYMICNEEMCLPPVDEIITLTITK